MRLGIVTSHPIQYQAPLFRALARCVDLRVYFAHQATAKNQAEAGFGVGFDWDTDLTGGFQHTVLQNVSRRPGITRFAGCDTPTIGKVLAADKIDARKLSMVGISRATCRPRRPPACFVSL